MSEYESQELAERLLEPHIKAAYDATLQSTIKTQLLHNTSKTKFFRLCYTANIFHPFVLLQYNERARVTIIGITILDISCDIKLYVPYSSPNVPSTEWQKSNGERHALALANLQLVPKTERPFSQISVLPMAYPQKDNKGQLPIAEPIVLFTQPELQFAFCEKKQNIDQLLEFRIAINAKQYTVVFTCNTTCLTIKQIHNTKR